MIAHIKEWLPHVKIIAGNVATPEAVKDLAIWGADCVKVGIAGGGACSTKNMTGFHVPMFSCVEDCVNWKELFISKEFTSEQIMKLSKLNIPIIADGGIKENGDIPKALVAGAKMVMAGSLFAACIDAPGENIYETKKEWTNIILAGENGNFHDETGVYRWADRSTNKVVKKTLLWLRFQT